MAATGSFSVRPLVPETWPDFARLTEAHGGIWGGCWCIGFHAWNFAGPDQNRALKEAMVREGTTHAALVFDGAACVGWAQYGSPAELPAIKNRKAYEAVLDGLPDWRITCLFVANSHRRRGVADAAAAGALELISRAGGGTVEAFPEDVEGRKVSGSFLWNGTIPLYQRLGFERVRQIGKFKWVMRRSVLPSEAEA